MSDQPSERAKELADRHDEDVAAHKEAAEAGKVEEQEFKDAGYDETLPGQTEIEAGSVQHEQLLKSYPNATSYAGNVNVVVPPLPEPPPEPEPPVDPPVAEEASGRQY